MSLEKDTFIVLAVSGVSYLYFLEAFNRMWQLILHIVGAHTLIQVTESATDISIGQT